jgi:hypothetical protein
VAGPATRVTETCADDNVLLNEVIVLIPTTVFDRYTVVATPDIGETDTIVPDPVKTPCPSILNVTSWLYPVIVLLKSSVILTVKVVTLIPSAMIVVGFIVNTSLVATPAAVPMVVLLTTTLVPELITTILPGVTVLFIRIVAIPAAAVT